MPFFCVSSAAWDYGHALSGVRVQRLDGAFAPRVLKFDMACGHEGCGGRLRRQYKENLYNRASPVGKQANRPFGRGKCAPPLVAAPPPFPR